MSVRMKRDMDHDERLALAGEKIGSYHDGFMSLVWAEDDKTMMDKVDQLTTDSGMTHRGYTWLVGETVIEEALTGSRIEKPDKRSASGIRVGMNKYVHGVPGGGKSYMLDFLEETFERIAQSRESFIKSVNLQQHPSARGYSLSPLIRGLDNLWEIGKEMMERNKRLIVVIDEHCKSLVRILAHIAIIDWLSVFFCLFFFFYVVMHCSSSK